MLIFEVVLTLRYTRISCMPFRAKMDFDRTVQAEDRRDALRQACLCLDRDLEEVLAHVNTSNVSEVLVELKTITEGAPTSEATPWNPEPFDPQLEVPPHIVVREEGARDRGGAA